MSLELYGFDEWERVMQRAVDNFPKKKAYLLMRLGRIYQAEVKKNTPVDTGRLKASIYVSEVMNFSSVFVGTNVEYAQFVEEGHKQHRRFVPGYWRKKGGFQYVPYYEGGGMMLSERWVQGSYMFRKGLLKAKPKFEREIKEFMRIIGDELND